METLILIDRLSSDVQGEGWMGLTKEEARKLLGYVKSLEQAMADLLRSTHERDQLKRSKNGFAS